VVLEDSIALVRDEGVALGEREILADHLLDEAREVDFRPPTQFGAGAARVA
jgi:hypothetical protein